VRSRLVTPRAGRSRFAERLQLIPRGVLPSYHGNSIQIGEIDHSLRSIQEVLNTSPVSVP
jgi:hypothetical protein